MAIPFAPNSALKWMIKHPLAWKISYVFIVTLILFSFSSHWSYDDPYMTYPYADNLNQGHGFVYNPGERVLSTTTPFFAILLSLFGPIYPGHAHLAVLIGALSLAAGAVMLFDLARIYASPRIGWAALIAYPTFPLLMTTLSSETPLYIALILASIHAYEHGRYSLTALIAGLAVLTRPDGILVAAVIAAHFLLFRRQPIPWKSILLFLVILLAWFGFAWGYFGSPIPVTLAAKQNQGAMANSLRFLPGLLRVAGWYSAWQYGVFLFFALLGVYPLVRRAPGWGLLLGWTLAYTLGYAVLGVSGYYWYYAPLIPALLVLSLSGAFWAAEKLARILPAQRLLPVGLFILFLLPLFFVEARALVRFRNLTDQRMQVYQEIGEWLQANSAPTSTVGSLEVGAIGYYARRSMVDFAGLIQPEIGAQLTAHTYEDAALFAASRYRPDYILIPDGSFPGLEASYLNQYCRPLQQFKSKTAAYSLFGCAR